MTDNYYGFNSTDEVKYDSQGLPAGTYKALALSEEPDAKGNGFIVEWEIVDGEFKGKKGKVWYLTLHPQAQTAAIARQNVKRLADASGKPVDKENPIKGRVLTLVVGAQKNDADRTEIKKYLPEDYQAEAEVPA